jgi:hypothetical protein
MAKVSLADHMKEHRSGDEELAEAGPFVTISRQYGCYGFSLGLLLLEILNEDAEPEATWKIYQKEILSKLATETDLAEEILQRERRSRPRMIVDFFRSLSKKKLPSGYEIRSRITTIIRGLAIEGHAIIVGQGGSAACHDLPNGLSVRLEANEDWRVKQVAFRENLSETEARLNVRNREQEREYLRKIYERRFPHKPAFHITYDCAEFSLAQIAQHVVAMMKMKKYC